MSVATYQPTARCVHCAWSTDREEPDAVRESREIHELIHPGGTVLVGPDRETPPAAEEEEPQPMQAEKTSRAPRVTWTRENAIEAIRAFHSEHGRTPRQPELTTANGLPANATLKRLFGSMGEAIRAAGFEPRPRLGARPSAAAPVPPKAVPDRANGGPGPHMAEGPPPLVEAAQRVSELAGRRRAMLAELDALEQELRSALEECESALAALRVEEAA